MKKNNQIKFSDNLFFLEKNRFALLLNKLFLKLEYFSVINFQVISTNNIKLPIIYANIRV
jgi:hypothetical protein